jgi:hypothetical protein
LVAKALPSQITHIEHCFCYITEAITTGPLQALTRFPQLRIPQLKLRQHLFRSISIREGQATNEFPKPTSLLRRNVLFTLALTLI